MPVRLVVRAYTSSTFPAPASWRKGDIVEARPLPSPVGNAELDHFVFCDLTFQNAPDPSWVQDQLDSQGGRRTIGVTEAEVDAIIAAGRFRTYSSAGQFISRLEQKKTGGSAAVFVGNEQK